MSTSLVSTEPRVASVDDDSSSIDTFELPSRVRERLKEILPAKNRNDPYLDEKFDVLDHINTLFPTEESLGDIRDGKLALTVAKIESECNQVERELSTAVRHAAINRQETRESIDNTKSSIDELFNKIKKIKDKAIESEKLVEEICSDIRRLDHAKNNLQQSITTLQKLHMLVQCVNELQNASLLKEYHRASNLLQALNDLFKHFNKYLKLTQLSQLKTSMEKVREELKQSVYRDFRKYDPKANINNNSNNKTSSGDNDGDDVGVIVGAFDDGDDDTDGAKEGLRNGCSVIDVMGSKERNDFIEWFANTQLQAYGAIFAPGSEKGGLDFLERRFSWLKTQLLKYNKNYSKIFPRYWNVPGHICKEFVSVTKEHLDKQLEQGNMMQNIDIQVLVKALEQCVSFERELQRLYSEPSLNDDLEKQKIAYQNLMGDYNEEDLDDPENITAEKIKIKHKLKQLKMKIKDLESQQEKEEKYKSDDQKMREMIDSINFLGSLSSAFDRYMKYYVELEQQNIRNVLLEIEKSEIWSPKTHSIPIDARYVGVDDLLGYIKRSIERCHKIATTKTFLQIYEMYKEGLLNYHDMLLKHSNDILKYNWQLAKHSNIGGSGSGGSNTGNSMSSSSSTNISGAQVGHRYNSNMAEFKDSDVIALSLIVNTAFYVETQCDRLKGNLHSIYLQIEEKEMALNEKMSKEQKKEEKFKNLLKKGGNKTINIKQLSMEQRYERLESLINLENISNKYNDLKLNGLNLMADGIGNKVGFLLYKNIEKSRKWGDLEKTDDQSSFVSLMKGHLINDLTIVHKLVVITESNRDCKFGLLHRHIVDCILPKYITGIFKIKKINEEGVHQLQIDTQLIRNILINLPYISLGGINDMANDGNSSNKSDKNNNDNNNNNNNNNGDNGNDISNNKDLMDEKLSQLDDKTHGSDGNKDGKNGNFIDISIIHRNRGKKPQISKIYGKAISKQMSKIEGLLKTVAARNANLQMLAETFKSIMFDTSKNIYGNVLDLQKICEIKGLRSADAKAAATIYNRMVPPSQQMNVPIIDVEATKSDFLRDVAGLFGNLK